MDHSLPEHTALITDFIEWQIKNPKKIISSGQSVTEDGRLVLNLSINGTSFRLLCPANYPNHEDSFFMETECTDFWCIALNEFIIDSPEKLTLDVILAKTFLYYTPPSKKSRESSDNESDNENDIDLHECSSGDSDSSLTDEWESIISKKKKEWREKEGELRLRYNRPKISDMFDGKIMDHPQQVFSNSAASEILINDLINIMASKEASGIVVDPVENDICKWSVFLKDFHPHSRIADDLEETKELFGYDHVQLQLDFIMDLYPSHPPLIRFIRPKLLGVFDNKELVKLANWNPARDMMSVLKEIKDYIDRNGRVDVGNECNGIKVGIVRKILGELADALKEETSSELILFQKCLAGTETSLSSKGRNNVIEMILESFLDCLKNPVCEKSSPETESHFTFNLALNNNVFDEKNYEVRLSKAINHLMENHELETQNCRANDHKVDTDCDRKHCNIITNPTFGLESQSRDSISLQDENYSVSNVSVHETNGTSNYSKNNSKRSQQRNKSIIEHVNNSVVSSFNANIKTLKGLSVAGSNNSALESNYNLSVVSKTLEESVLLSFMRAQLAEDALFEIWLSAPVYSKIIEILIKLASNPYLIDSLTSSNAPDQSIPDLLKIQAQNVTLILEKLEDVVDGRHMKQADLDKADLARRIIDTSKLVESELMKYSSRIRSNHVFSDSNNQILESNPNQYEVKSLDSVYKDCLKDLKFCNYDIDIETHTFKSDYIAEVNSSRNYFRIAQELALLSKSLPLELSSGIFVRWDKTKPALMRALITGLENTLCSGGAFSFDIYIKKDYPNGGLEISCTTFRDGETTWLPNDRLVSLSLGEDVSSPDPESWTKFPNILQVLTFIQRQKLIPCEVYGESREDSGPKETLLMNVIRFAMINQMRKPTPGFEELIATHFRLKKDRILSELGQYDFLKNSELLDSLKKEFDRLTTSQET